MLACVALLFAGCNQATDDGNSGYIELNDGNPVSAAYAADAIIRAEGGTTVKAILSNEGLDKTDGEDQLISIVNAMITNPRVNVELDLSNVWFDDDDGIGGATEDVFGAKVEWDGVDEGGRKVDTKGKFPNAATNTDLSFAGLKNLTKITLPFTIEEIEDDAFAGCENLEEVTINFFFTADVDKNGKYTGEYMFDDVYLLTKIGNNAFDGCKSLRTFIITSDPDNDETQGAATDEAFPVSLADIGDYAFRNCYALENIRFLTSRNCETNALHGTVDETTLKDGWKDSSYLLDGVLRNRVNPSSVAGITAGNIGITTTQLFLKLGTGAFQNCTSVETLDLTNKVKLDSDTVTESAFDGCTSLRTIYLNSIFIGDKAVDPADKTKTGLGFAGYEVGSVQAGLGNLHTAIDGAFAPVTVFGAKSFQFTALSGDTVADLFHMKDYSPTGLLDAATGADGDIVTEIGARAFFGCKELGETVELPSSVDVSAKLGDGAFANSSVRYIYLHADDTSRANQKAYSVTPQELDADGTLKYWLGALLDAEPVQGTSPKVIYAWYVLNEDIDGNLGYLPDSQNPNTKVLGEALEEIKGDAFYNNVDLKRIVLPSGIDAAGKLGDYAFANAENLEFAAYDSDTADWGTIYDNKTVGIGAFSNVALTEVVLADGTKAVVNNR